MLLHKSFYLFETVNMSDCCLFVCLFVVLLSSLRKTEIQHSSKMILRRLTISLSSGKGGKAFSVVKSKCACSPSPLLTSDRASLWNSVYLQCCILNMQCTKSNRSKKVITVTVCTIFFVATDLCLRYSSPLPRIHADSAEVVLLMLWIRPLQIAPRNDNYDIMSCKIQYSS